MHLHNQTELLRLDDIRVALKEGKRRFYRSEWGFCFYMCGKKPGDYWRKRLRENTPMPLYTWTFRSRRVGNRREHTI